MSVGRDEPRAARYAAAALIGGCLIDPAAVGEAAAIVGVDDFPGPWSREVFGAMLALHHRGQPWDFVHLVAELEARGTLDRIGEARLIEAVNRCPTSAHVEAYARQLKQAGGAPPPGVIDL